MDVDNFSEGGLFHFSGEYDLAADNVKNFEVSTSQQLVPQLTNTLTDCTCRRNGSKC